MVLAPHRQAAIVARVRRTGAVRLADLVSGLGEHIAEVVEVEPV